ADEEVTSPPELFTITYRFLHDRVQQAAYSLIEDEKRREVHLRIGRLMRGSGERALRDDELFEIVNHLNLGAALITDRDERLGLARLNLTAGRKAKAATAYSAAASYLRAGMALLDGESLEQDDELSFDLHAERAECEYLIGAFKDAEALFDSLFARARSDHLRAEIASLRMVLDCTR